jgi:Uma2 family endonuclease
MEVVFDAITAAQDSVIQVKTGRRVTREEYRAFCAANPDLRIERTAEGELIVMPPTHPRSGDQNADLIFQARAWARQDRTGISFDSATGFDLPNGSNRSPDTAWIRKDRIEALSPEEREEYYPLCPDFVVELRSKSDSLPKLHAKMREYIECGAQLGWLLDPFQRRVWVYRPGKAVEILDNPDTLIAGPLMPGFVLDLQPIWNPQA